MQALYARGPQAGLVGATRKISPKRETLEIGKLYYLLGAWKLLVDTANQKRSDEQHSLFPSNGANIMFRRRMSHVAIACGVAVVMLCLPAVSSAGCFLDCLFGSSPCSQTTYAPSFAPSYAVSTCNSCVPQTCQYTPQVVYRPIPITYRPVSTCAPCTGYVATTYRPLLGWPYQTRLVPYTTYRPACGPTVYYPSCAPCGGCSPCASGSCGSISYGATTSDCTSCGVPAASAPAPSAASPKTFQENVKKPATNEDLKPIPQTDAQPNSMPMPLLPDPRDRTASRIRTASWPSPDVSARNDGGWRPSRD